MTTPVAALDGSHGRDRRVRSRSTSAAVVVVVGCVLLAARPVLARLPFGASGAPAVLIAGFVVLLAVGARWPIPEAAGTATAGTWCDPRTWAAIAVGLAAFTLGRVVGGGHPAVPVGWFVIATNTLAALAEEAFFRRLCFGLLAPAGVGWAIVGSSLLFAAVHVSTYGLWVLPLDLAAGLVLGWQRAATGSWAAPAVTHVLVNLMVVL